LFIAATSSSASQPTARPNAVGARLSDAMSMARRRSRFLNFSPMSSRVRAPPRAARESVRVISVHPFRSIRFLRTAIATKIFVVDAIGRISSASLPKISAPVSASMTTADLDFTSGRSPAHVGTTSPQTTPTITNERIWVYRDMSRDALATFHQVMS
jgi:hypothetical protein